MENLFYKKGIDIADPKQMFNFLKNHFMYDTLNSWNNLKSIANNVKIYNLKLDGDCWTALTFLNSTEYIEVNQMIEDWEDEHPNYKVGFNGRSGGYLVLYNKDNSRNILPGEILDSENYEDFKDNLKEYWGGVKYFMNDLRFYTKLVQDFDRLCDSIREYVNGLSKLDFVKETLISVCDDFNTYYKDDLKRFNFNLLEVDENNNIDISQIRQSQALYDCLRRIFEAYTEQGYHIEINDKYITLKN